MKREDLLQYVPKSNWDRYFSNIVECEGEYILKRWNTLYELRCKIAHNKIVIKKDYERITCLIKEV